MQTRLFNSRMGEGEAESLENACLQVFFKGWQDARMMDATGGSNAGKSRELITQGNPQWGRSG